MLRKRHLITDFVLSRLEPSKIRITWRLFCSAQNSKGHPSVPKSQQPHKNRYPVKRTWGGGASDSKRSLCFPAPVNNNLPERFNVVAFAHSPKCSSNLIEVWVQFSTTSGQLLYRPAVKRAMASTDYLWQLSHSARALDRS